ncbi:MAG TPA: hypothetical protein VKR41_04105, partial [Puia sp.]|nr:hypothetical protein [Puia sp.]
MIRHDWTIEEIREIYNTPLLDLIYKAASVHKQHNDTGEVQVCTLLSIKTGGCPEDWMPRPVGRSCSARSTLVPTNCCRAMCRK